MSALAKCKHGREPMLDERNDYSFRMYSCRYSARRWWRLFGPVCCAGPWIDATNDKEERHYAEKTALKAWQRMHDAMPLPQTDLDRLRDWFESPE